MIDVVVVHDNHHHEVDMLFTRILVFNNEQQDYQMSGAHLAS